MTSQLKDYIANKLVNIVSDSVHVDKTIYCNDSIIGRLASNDITDEYTTITYTHVMAGNKAAQYVPAFNSVTLGKVGYAPNANDVTGIVNIPKSGLYAITGSCTLVNYTAGDKISIALVEVISGKEVVVVNKMISMGTTNPMIVFSNMFIGKVANIAYRFAIQNEMWKGANPIVAVQADLDIIRVK